MAAAAGARRATQLSSSYARISSSMCRRCLQQLRKSHSVLQTRTTATIDGVTQLSQARRFHGSSRREGESLRPQTFYDFFPESISGGPPPGGPFSVDLKQLRNEFLRKQALAHPDRHTGLQDKAKAEALSAQINEAYRTLQSPLLRAQYLLSLRGINLAEDETAKVEDQQLLMIVMDAQEAVEEAQEEADLAGVTQQNDARIAESVGRLERAFADQNIDAAAQEAVRLRYWTTIRDAIQSWEKGKPVVIIH